MEKISCSFFGNEKPTLLPLYPRQSKTDSRCSATGRQQPIGTILIPGETEAESEFTATNLKEILNRAQTDNHDHVISRLGIYDVSLKRLQITVTEKRIICKSKSLTLLVCLVLADT